MHLFHVHICECSLFRDLAYSELHLVQRCSLFRVSCSEMQHVPRCSLFRDTFSSCLLCIYATKLQLACYKMKFVQTCILLKDVQAACSEINLLQRYIFFSFMFYIDTSCSKMYMYAACSEFQLVQTFSLFQDEVLLMHRKTDLI